MGSQQPQICVRWNAHQTNLLSVFDHLLQHEAFVDVTLACDGQSLKAHKVVLSACSPLFQKLLLDNPCQHPIIILNNVDHHDLRSLIHFMYKGEVNIAQDQLPALLRTAENLKVKGLSEVMSNAANANAAAGGASETATGGGSSSSNNDVSILAASADRASGSTRIEHPNPCTSPAGKRKRLRRRHKSSSNDAGHANENCSPSVIGGRKDDDDVDDDDEDDDDGNSINADNASASTSSNGAASSSKGHDGGGGTGGSGDCLPEARIHEGFTQDNEEGQGTSLVDASNFLSLPPYVTSQQQQQHHFGGGGGDHHQQQHPHQTLNPCLPPHAQPSTSSHNIHAQQDTAITVVNNNAPQVTISTLVVQPQHQQQQQQQQQQQHHHHHHHQQQQQLQTSNKHCSEGGGGVGIGGGITIEASRSSDHWETSNVDVNHALEAALRHHAAVTQGRGASAAASGRLSGTASSSSLYVQQASTSVWGSSTTSINRTSSSKRSDATISIGCSTTDSSLAIPKREYSISSSACTTAWTEDSLAQALDAIRAGRMSITKAAVTFGIPNTTLWQRTRREGIDTSRNGASCHQATTGWTESNLAQALDAVRSGRMSVNRASTTYGIPSTTLWSRAKRYGIETHRRLPGGGNNGSGGSASGTYDPHERDEVMWHALQAVKAGVISMTQASIKYNLPYTTLWKHFKKWEIAGGALTIPLSMSMAHAVVPSTAAMVMASSSAGGGGGGTSGGGGGGSGGHHHHHHHHGALHSHPIDSIVGEQTTAT